MKGQVTLTTYCERGEDIALCPQSVLSSPRHTQPTSRDAYRAILDEGVLGEQVLAYLRVLREHKDGLTDKQASVLLGIPASTVSARRNDVAKSAGTHIIVNIDGERRQNERGRTGLVWRLRE